MTHKEKTSVWRQVWSSRLSRRLALFSLVLILVITLASIQAYRLLLQDPFASAMPLILVLFLVAILSVAILIFVVSSSVLSPLMQLYNATLEVEKGNFDTRVDIRTKDDLEELGNRFNTMVGALSKVRKDHQQIDRAKTEFLSITSHELRSPMTPMRAQLQMLLKGYQGALNSKQKESLTIVLRNTERLDKIIADFLDVSRIEAARLKFYFVKTILSEHIVRLVEEMKGFMPEKKIKIVTRLDKISSFECDPDRVMQVLRNLVNNAIKFSPENGTIVIRAQQQKSFVQIGVEDSGIGIAHEHLSQVFEPFFQVEHGFSRRYGGAGLGLAICKGIVESQNGRIWVESTKGKGSTFYFTVPLTPVREPRPVRVLFSPQGDMEARVRDIFIGHLGGADGAEAFGNVQRHGLRYEGLVSSLTKLRDHNVLDYTQHRQILSEIRSLYGLSKTPQQELVDMLEEIYVSTLGPLGLKQFAKIEKNLSRQAVHRQIDGLVSSRVLSGREAQVFKQHITKAFAASRQKRD